MGFLIYTYLFAVLGCQLVHSAILEKFHTYEDAREAIIRSEDLLITGGGLHLNEKESKVDDIFMKYKLEELSRGFRKDEVNAPAMHFFKAKKLIEISKVFRFLRHMPKGAVLHMHNTASVTSEWVVRNISYTPGLLRCTNRFGNSILSFRRNSPLHECQSQYVRVSEERLRSISPAVYDRSFEKLINLFTEVPEFEYPSINVVWNKFDKMFGSVTDAIRYLPIYRAYHWRMLEELYEDHIMYAEIRTSLSELYDLSGRTFPTEHTVRQLLSVVEDFRREHTDFIGIKVIMAPSRRSDNKEVREKFELFKKLHSEFPNFIVGFDLIGQEDRGKPLYNFVNELTELPSTARFFFHAGETNWYGSSTDINLLDAILLNTTRIGHGYALIKHPVLYNAVKARNIAIEVSPISNQVLHLVSDMRNHPGAFLMSQNIPMVICSDDPGFWSTRGLSYDFYYAIMSMAPNNAGLKTLKTLVWNSINYSILNDKERDVAYKQLQADWDHFVDDVLKGYVFY